MRYMTITYFTQPNGKIDESVAVTTTLKNKDLATASVILDFRAQSVLKCTMNGVIVPKEWKKIRDFYHQYYPQYIKELEKHYEESNNPS
jgi:hypothetical protein